MAFYNNQLDKHEGYHKGMMRILTWGKYNEGYREDVGQQVFNGNSNRRALVNEVLSMNLNYI